MRKKLATVVFVLCIIVGMMLPVFVQAETTTYSGSNVNAQNYSRWSSTIKSYLEECEDGSLMRVQYVASVSSVIVEYYDSSYHLLNTKEITQELPVFGGFYATDDNYYLVTGQTNPEESADVEVYRITKYDKNWNRIASVGLYGANTTVPFDAGSLRMDSWGKYLLIRTSHEMYEYIDGINHQANVTIQVDTETMQITNSATEIMNNSYGYVSHSFNQFIKIEDGKIVAVDHGDASPRSIVLCQYPTDVSTGSFTSWNVQCTNVLTFPGELGENVTGASVGGFELSDDSYLIAGNSVVQDENNLTRTTRNVFLAAVDKDTKKVTMNWLTDFEEGDATTTTPQLVKISDNRFMIIWSRGNAVYYTECDGTGKQTGAVYCMEGANSSDCLPIVKDNKVIWYAWSYDKVTFYEIGLDKLARPQGTVLQNGSSTTKTFCADLKHSIKSVSYLESTCTTDGHIAHWACEVCGMAYADAAGTMKYTEQEVLLPAAHTYENQGVTNGAAHLVCAVCGEETDRTVITSMNIFGSEDNKIFSTAFEKNRTVGDILYISVSRSPANADLELEVLISDTDIVSYTKTADTLGYLTMLDSGVVTVTIRPKWNPTLEKSFTLTVRCEDQQYENTGIVDGCAVLVCSGCGSTLKVPVMTSLSVWWNEDGGTKYSSAFAREKNVNDILYYYVTYTPAGVDSELEILISDPTRMSYKQTSASLGYFTMLKPGTVTITIRPKLNPALSKQYTITILGEETTPVSDIFADVSAGEWFEPSIQYVYDKGIMTGLNKTNFGTYEKLARAQFASVLYSINGQQKVEFEDVFADVAESDWYADAVLWAYKEGVVSGYDSGCFGAGDTVTREQMAIMMYNYADAKGYDTAKRADLSTFNDAEQISWYAEEAMQWAVSAGVITGKNNGTVLDAWGETTRAECASIIEKFMKYAGI